MGILNDNGVKTVILLAAAMLAVAALWVEASLSWEETRITALQPKPAPAAARTVRPANPQSVALIAARVRRGETIKASYQPHD